MPTVRVGVVDGPHGGPAAGTRAVDAGDGGQIICRGDCVLGAHQKSVCVIGDVLREVRVLHAGHCPQ